MSRRILYSLVLLTLLLAACQGQVSQTAVTTQSAALPAQSTPQGSPTSQPAPTGEAKATSLTPAGPAAPPGCTVVSSQVPTPDATQEALVPPVSAKDWAQGPAGAHVTIIEYGDFM